MIADPGHVGARNDLAWLLAEEGQDLDTALALALAAQRLDPSPDVLDTLGWVYLKRGESAEAVKAFEQAVEKRPDSASMRYRLADRAQPGGRQAARPRDVPDRARHGRLPRGGGRPPRARAARGLSRPSRRCRAASGGCAAASWPRRCCCSRRAPRARSASPSTSSAASITRPRAASPEALLEYQSALELDPRDAELYQRIGDLLARRREYKDAISYYRQAFELDPERIGAAMSEARLLAFGDPKRARELVQLGLERAPDRSDVQLTRAHVALASGDLEEAQARRRSAPSSSSPSRARAWAQLGKVHQARIRKHQIAGEIAPPEVFQAALDAFARVDQIEKGDAHAQVERARILAAWAGHRDEALAAHRAAIADREAARRRGRPARSPPTRSTSSPSSSTTTRCGARRCARSSRRTRPTTRPGTSLVRLSDGQPRPARRGGLPRADREAPRRSARAPRVRELPAAQATDRPTPSPTCAARSTAACARRSSGSRSSASRSAPTSSPTRAPRYVELADAFPDDPITRGVEAQLAVAEGRFADAAVILRELVKTRETSDIQRMLAVAEQRLGQICPPPSPRSIAPSRWRPTSVELYRLKASIHYDAKQWGKVILAYRVLAGRGRHLSPADEVRRARALYEFGRPDAGRAVLDAGARPAEPSRRMPPSSSRAARAARSFEAGARRPCSPRRRARRAIRACSRRSCSSSSRRGEPSSRSRRSTPRSPPAARARACCCCAPSCWRREGELATRRGGGAAGLRGGADAAGRRRAAVRHLSASGQARRGAALLRAGRVRRLAAPRHAAAARAPLSQPGRSREGAAGARAGRRRAAGARERAQRSRLRARVARRAARPRARARARAPSRRWGRTRRRSTRSATSTTARGASRRRSRSCERAIALAGSRPGGVSPTYTYHLGLVLEALGRKPEAASAFERALASTDEFPEAEDARRRLESVQATASARRERVVAAAGPPTWRCVAKGAHDGSRSASRCCCCASSSPASRRCSTRPRGRGSSPSSSGPRSSRW